MTLILLDGEQTLLEIEGSIHHTCLNGSAISSADAKVRQPPLPSWMKQFDLCTCQWVSTIDLDEQLVTSHRPLNQFRPAALFTTLNEFEARQESVVVLSRFTHIANGHLHTPMFPAGQADAFTERLAYEGNSSGPKSIGLLGSMSPQVQWVCPVLLEQDPPDSMIQAHHWLEPNAG